MSRPTIIKFDQTGDFAACMAAEQWCRDNGYSVGSMQRGSPRGLLQGDYAIAKWRNLSAVERKALHGEMRGDMRRGPVFIELDSPIQASPPLDAAGREGA